LGKVSCQQGERGDVAHTGRVITSAALIMVSVFFAFVLNVVPALARPHRPQLLDRGRRGVPRA
jgi:hypothetical protein